VLPLIDVTGAIAESLGESLGDSLGDSLGEGLGETFERGSGHVADDAAAETADTGVPEPTPAVSLPPEARALLERAAQLLDEGEITMPPRNNAVALLQRVLEIAPDHPEARAMLEQCSEHLVSRASAYQQRGMEFEARNTLEEVFAFDPGHREANRLWDAWVGRPR
jgi:tetratricopeptide (TPR) repeat protein